MKADRFIYVSTLDKAWQKVIHFKHMFNKLLYIIVSYIYIFKSNYCVLHNIYVYCNFIV